jgi:hypothetical protein
VRAAVVAALLADAGVAALVGTRVYPRLGLFGGLEAEGSTAITADGELAGPTIVVALESRTRHDDDRGAQNERTIRAVQTFVLLVYAPEGMGGDAYRAIREVHLAARRLLHRRPLVPLEETQVRWLDTRWTAFGPDQVEAPRQLPVVAGHYDAVITDPL